MRSKLAGKFGRLGMGALLAAASSLAVACGDASGSTSQTWHSNGGYTGSPGAATGGASGSSSGGSTSGGGSSSGGASGGASGSTSSSGSSGASGGSSGAAAPSFTVQLGSAALKGDLMTDQTTVVTVIPANGFTGTVTLAVGTAPGLAAKLDKTTVTITGSAAASANLTLNSTTIGDTPVHITATSGAIATTSNVTLSAANHLTLYIPADAETNKGTSAAPYNTAFGPASGVVVHGAAPLKLTIVNKDSTGHIIHADGKNGFAHGDTNNALGQGASDQVRTLTAQTTYNWYLHDQQGALVTGKLILQP